jgi:hypothetical protein
MRYASGGEVAPRKRGKLYLSYRVEREQHPQDDPKIAFEVETEAALRRIVDMYGRNIGSDIAADFLNQLAVDIKSKKYDPKNSQIGLLPSPKNSIVLGRGRPKGSYGVHDSGHMALKLFHLTQDGYSIEKLTDIYWQAWVASEGRNPDATPIATARTRVRRLVKRGKQMQALADRLAKEIDLAVSSATPGEALKNALLKRNN